MLRFPHFPCRWKLVGGALLIAFLSVGARAESSLSLALTPEEKRWLAEHPTIRLSYDPQWPPFSFQDKAGNFTGLDADVATLLQERLGITFQLVNGKTWEEVYDRAKRGEVDVLVGTALTPERERLFRFSHHYQSIPVGIITVSDRPFLWSVYDLAGRRVASPRGYATTAALEREYPDIQLRYTADTGEAFELVAKGKADAVITNLVNASYIIKTRGLSNLKIVGVMPDTFDLRYAVRSDWPELVTILDKGIASITKADLQALNHRWVRVDYAAVIRWDIVWKVAAIVFATLGAAIGFLAWHHRSLRVELRKRSELQAALEASHARLSLANGELQARHEEIVGLMSVAAHDLRNPLTSVRLSAEMLRMSGEPATRVTAEAILSTARQMCELIDDLLDVHALEEGSRKFSLVKLDAVDVVRNSVESLAPLARRKDISFDLSGIASMPALVQVDSSAFRQVCDNLLSNALKFSPLGRTIRVRVGKWNEFVRCEFEDEGPGVPAHERERIFTKYTRGSAKPTAGEKSTGLGLAIVRESVAAMNGRVWCQEAAGGGACFVVALPALDAGADESSGQRRV